jgi:hypothetical protein
MSRPLYPSESTLLIWAVSAAVFLCSFLASARPSLAGANKGGMIILHCNESIEFTTDGDFNGYSELRDCRNAVTEVPGEGQAVVYFVLAAFDDFATPAVLSIHFGIELSSPLVEPIRGGPSGWDTFEVADDRWPASGTGTGIFWNGGALTGRLSEVYWFAGYAYAGQTVRLTPHPTGVGRFADTSVPPEEDEIEGYGILGFGVKGFNPRCGETATGACCNTAGRCTLVSKDGCTLDPGYIYQGDNTTCSPSPCLPESTDAPRLALASGPNPFKSSTTIRYDLPWAGAVRLDIHDAGGHLVRTLVDDIRPAGPHSLAWDGTSARGEPTAGGVYFILLSAPEGRTELKAIRVK